MCIISASKKLPSFIEDRLNFFVDDFLKSTSSQKHLVVGTSPKQGDIVLQSNDYLAITNHPEIKNAQINALNEINSSVVMSAVFRQEDETSNSFESKLARLLGKQSSILTQSGWSANIGLLQTICSPNTPVYIDFLAHMSLWEGIRAAKAKPVSFMHNHMKHLIRQIKQNGPGVIVVDSIYSTIGTIAPLEELCKISELYNCALVVDESHSLGTHGPQGAGLVKALGLTDRVDFITASLAKAFAYRAGAIIGCKKLGDTLPFVSFPAIFSSALLPAEIARLNSTLEVISNADEKRAKLATQSEKLIRGLKDLGLKIRSQSQVVALESGDESSTELLRNYLESEGIFGSIFCRPATPKNKNIIRFSLHSDVTDEELKRVIDTCKLAIERDLIKIDT